MKPFCIVQDCGLDEHARGLCRSHYRYALLLVKSGRFSWYDLEIKGKAKPKKNRVGASNAWFHKGPEEEPKTIKSKLCGFGQELVLPALLLCFAAVPVGVVALFHLVFGIPFK